MIDREKFFSYLNSKLDDIESRNVDTSRAVSIEKVLLFVIDSIHKGNFKGIISIKIYNGDIFSPRVDQLETSVESDYKWLDL